MLQFVIILKALAEVALFAFLGQAILYLFAGAKRDQNFVYGTFKMLTSPVTPVGALGRAYASQDNAGTLIA